MTTPNDLPTAQQALGLAFEIVRSPCSAAEAQRAEILLGIAREIREEQQYRSTRRALTAFAGKPDHVHIAPSPESTTLRGYLNRFTHGRAAEGGPVEPPAYAGETAYARAARLAGPGLATGGVIREDIAVTQVVPALAEQTQKIPILWRVGDKADCRHCHTPIILSPRRMKDPLAEGEADVPALWVHKYTDQRACAEPTMSSDDDEPTRAFAEPSIG